VRRILAALMLLVPFVLRAEHPNDARGFSPDRVFNFHGIDTVNSFNGNLLIRIPIGPEYKVNGRLAYQLALTYNSHCWRFDVLQPEGETGSAQITARPIYQFNAGLGWTLSLGRLYEGPDPAVRMPTNIAWTYQGPDGADHSFYNDLHNGDTSDAPVEYTRDGTYIRTRPGNETTTRLIEFPDGIVHVFTQLDRTSISPSGVWSRSTTSHRWYLTEMRDSFGNSVSIEYSTVGGYNEIWKISDVARTTTVYFLTPFPANFETILDHVSAKAVNGQTAQYTFTTEVWDVPPGNGDTNPPHNETVQVLTEITPPAGNGYTMRVDNHPAYDTSTLTPGVLTRLQLPTLGSIGWTYEIGELGNRESFRSPAIEGPAVVVSRRLYDAAGVEKGTWTYGRRASDFTNCSYTCGGGTCTSGRARQMTTWVMWDPLESTCRHASLSIL